MRHLSLLLALVVTLALIVRSDPSAAHPLDKTAWIADSRCDIEALYLDVDGEADIDFGSVDFDFGYWWTADNGKVLFIEFEFSYATFLAIYDGTTIRAAVTYTWGDENQPRVQMCTFSRER